MTLQLSVAVRNARLDSIETTIGASAKAKIYSAAAVLLCDIALPADWMNAASSGAKTKAGTWQGVGTAGAALDTDATYFTITDTAGVNVGIAGSITGIGGGGDMILDNVNISETQIVTVTQFTLTDGNA